VVELALDTRHRGELISEAELEREGGGRGTARSENGPLKVAVGGGVKRLSTTDSTDGDRQVKMSPRPTSRPRKAGVGGARDLLSPPPP
jgi:hypothetical protein